MANGHLLGKMFAFGRQPHITPCLDRHRAQHTQYPTDTPGLSLSLLLFLFLPPPDKAILGKAGATVSIQNNAYFNGGHDLKQRGQRVGIDVTVAERCEGGLRTGGSLGDSNSPIGKLPGLPQH